MTTIVDHLFNELSNGGKLQPERITDDWLESIRTRIETGELPRFMETDDHQGWLIYARSRIEGMLVKHRRTIASQAVRGFAPISQDEGRAQWVRTNEDPEVAAAHARHRMAIGVRTSVQLHGSMLVALGQATWADVRNDAYAAVNEAVGEPASVLPTEPEAREAS